MNISKKVIFDTKTILNDIKIMKNNKNSDEHFYIAACHFDRYNLPYRFDLKSTSGNVKLACALRDYYRYLNGESISIEGHPITYIKTSYSFDAYYPYKSYINNRNIFGVHSGSSIGVYIFLDYTCDIETLHSYVTSVKVYKDEDIVSIKSTCKNRKDLITAMDFIINSVGTSNRLEHHEKLKLIYRVRCCGKNCCILMRTTSSSSSSSNAAGQPDWILADDNVSNYVGDIGELAVEDISIPWPLIKSIDYFISSHNVVVVRSVPNSGILRKMKFGYEDEPDEEDPLEDEAIDSEDIEEEREYEKFMHSLEVKTAKQSRLKVTDVKKSNAQTKLVGAEAKQVNTEVKLVEAKAKPSEAEAKSVEAKAKKQSTAESRAMAHKERKKHYVASMASTASTADKTVKSKLSTLSDSDLNGLVLGMSRSSGENKDTNGVNNMIEQKAVNNTINIDLNKKYRLITKYFFDNFVDNRKATNGDTVGALIEPLDDTKVQYKIDYATLVELAKAYLLDNAAMHKSTGVIRFIDNTPSKKQLTPLDENRAHELLHASNLMQIVLHRFNMELTVDNVNSVIEKYSGFVTIADLANIFFNVDELVIKTFLKSKKITLKGAKERSKSANYNGKINKMLTKINNEFLSETLFNILSQIEDDDSLSEVSKKLSNLLDT